jgi:hypothetical protein
MERRKITAPAPSAVNSLIGPFGCKVIWMGRGGYNTYVNFSN